MIRLRTLGTIEIRTGSDAAEAVVATPGTVARLAYLARVTSTPSTDGATSLGRGADERAMHERLVAEAREILRRDFGVADTPPAGTIECDAVRFDAAFDAERYVEAVAEYAGDFLPGIAVPDAPRLSRWIEDERARLRARADEASARIADSPRPLGTSPDGRPRHQSPQAKAMWILTWLGVIVALVIPVVAHYVRAGRS